LGHPPHRKHARLEILHQLMNAQQQKWAVTAGAGVYQAIAD